MGSKEVFRLDKTLGVGSFGTTYLAFVLDEKLKRNWGESVVIKIPHNKEKEKSLIQELNFNYRLSELNCANVVQYLGYEKYDDKFVMVTEYVVGESLRDKMGEIGRQRVLGKAESIGIIKQICKGLIEIHHCRIFHRDIKPDNILITIPGNVVKISDFGISTAIRQSELASTTSGTIVYMPKEILEGEGGAFYSDIYSLGVTFYEMITGQLPFDGNNYSELISKICHSEPIEPKSVNPEIDDKLNAILLKALNKDVKDRYQSAEELLQILERYEQGSDFDISEAWELFRLGKVSAAEKKFQQLLKTDPENPKVYLSLGELLNKCQRHVDATAIYRKGIARIGNSALLHRDLALSLYSEGKVDEAIQNLTKAINLGLDERFAKIAKILLDKWC